MTTKYVLNSGGIRGSGRGGDFLREVLAGTGERPRLLMCFFAGPREDWEARYAEFSAEFRSWVPEIPLTCTLAMPDEFPAQVAAADAIYLHGGDDHLVQHWLRHFDLPALWAGKVVATSSASSHALSRHFWTCDWRQCMDGLGIVPIKFLAHFGSAWGREDPRGPIDWEAARTQLEAYGEPGLPVHALPEGEWVTYHC